MTNDKNAHVEDFLAKEVTVTVGRTFKQPVKVTLSTPNLKWWFDFFLPLQTKVQWQAVDANTRKELIQQVRENKITDDLMDKLKATPNILNLLLEIAIYYVNKDRDWCFEYMTIADFLEVINAWLSVIDIKRALGFFVDINRKMPMASGLIPTA